MSGLAATFTEEVRAIREAVALSEPADVALVRIDGEGAYDAVDGLCPIELYLREGQVRQTLLLDERGRPRADLYLAADSDGFLLVAEGMASADLAALMRERAGADAVVVDLAETHGVLELNGPFAWEALAAIEGQEVVGFPYLTFYRPTDRRIYMRAGKTGEYSYDLIVPREEAPSLRQQIVEVGQELDLRVVGTEAIRHAQLESWFFDIHREGQEDLTPIELGLQWRVSFRKEYLGSAALREHRSRGVRRRVVPLRSAAKLASGDEITLDDERVGTVLHGERSVTLGEWIAVALLDAPVWHSGIDAFRVGGEPARSVSAPFVTQRSLFVNPQRHSYEARAEIPFPP